MCPPLITAKSLDTDLWSTYSQILGYNRYIRRQSPLQDGKPCCGHYQSSRSDLTGSILSVGFDYRTIRDQYWKFIGKSVTENLKLFPVYILTDLFIKINTKITHFWKNAKKFKNTFSVNLYCTKAEKIPRKTPKILSFWIWKLKMRYAIINL